MEVRDRCYDVFQNVAAYSHLEMVSHEFQSAFAKCKSWRSLPVVSKLNTAMFIDDFWPRDQFFKRIDFS